MRKIVLYDIPDVHANLLPLSFTRPIADFRVGITTIREKWERMMPGEYCYATVDFLRAKFQSDLSGMNLYIMSNVFPSCELVSAIETLKEGEALCKDGNVIAFYGTIESLNSKMYVERCYEGEVVAINYLFDVFLLNGRMIKQDFEELTKGRKSAKLSSTNILIGNAYDEQGNPMLFIEESASVEGAILNVSNGPIYIGANSEVMEGSCVRGPMSLGEHSHVNMGSKIYGDTTIGPWCKVGGELNNAVFFGYSNKAHDGFVGNAVIGEWCNIGAGTNASNLKNDYSKIRIWNYPQHTFMRTDLQFCGLIMGDHSKAGINCMFNTATVLGVGVNIHGAGFPRTFIPSFTEGSAVGGFTDVQLKKFFEIAGRAMARRGKVLTETDYEIFETIYEIASKYKY